MTHPFLQRLAAGGWPVNTHTTPIPRRDHHVPSAPAGNPEAARYALRALERECMDVATSPEGTRNHNLNRAAFSIGQLVAAGHLDPDAATRGLTDAAHQAGLDLPEIEGTLPRSLADGGQHPREVNLTPREEITPAHAIDPTHINGHDTDDEGPVESIFDRAVRQEYNQLVVREEARRQLDAERAGDSLATAPEPVTLTDFLAIPDTDAEYRIDELLPVGGRALLAAQYKAGKTTMIANLLRALGEGGKFLGKFGVGQPATVTLIDDELDERMLRRWLREQRIDPQVKINIVPLRGRVSTFDLTEDRTRDHWSEKLSGTDVLILDCLRPVLDGAGLDENKEAGLFLNAFDELLADTRIDEAVIVHHMGHGAQRSRGDSRILDWPDSTWKITRDDPEDPASQRYFSAFGRDVNVAEGMLRFDDDTKRLHYTGLSKKAGKGVPWVPALIKHLDRTFEAPSYRELRESMHDISGARDAADAAITLARDEQIVRTERAVGRRGGGQIYVLNRSHPDVVDTLGSMS